MSGLRLTPEQAALIPRYREEWTRYREEWTRIGLDTSPADRGLAERGIRDAYRAAGLKAPRIMWSSSPLAMALSRALVLNRVTGAQARRIETGVQARVEVADWPWFWDCVMEAAAQSQGATVGASVGASLTDRLGMAPRDGLRTTLRARVQDESWNRVAEDLARPVRARVARAVWLQVGRALWDSVGASVASDIWAPFRASVRDAICASIHGQHDAAWLGLYDFFTRAAGLGQGARALNPQWAVARAAGWWLPMEGICWVCESPKALAMEEEAIPAEGGALHAPNRPALIYPDGWSLYAWRGTLVPRAWITHPERLTACQALTHPQIDRRRAACEIVGWDAVLSTLSPRSIQKDRDPTIGELVEVDLPDIGPARFLRVTCGTGRHFALPVPPDMTSALQANAWTYGLDPVSFHPEVRT